MSDTYATFSTLMGEEPVGSSDVSLDLVCKALFALGISKKQIASAIAA